MTGKENKKSGNPKPSHSRNSFLSKYAWIILVATGSILYAQTLGFDFVHCDDHEIILRDFARIDNIGSSLDEFGKGYMKTDYYRPIQYLSFIFNAQIGGQSPFIYHLSNVIIHILNILCVFHLFRILKIPLKAAFLAALVFAVHPILANAVAWIVGRNDMLYSLFCLLSLIGLIKYSLSSKPVFLFLHAISFLIALLSKESAIMFTFVFAAYIVIYKEGKLLSLKNIIPVLIWPVMIFIWYFMRFNADLGEQVYSSGIDIFIQNLAVIPEFITKIIAPFDLSVLSVYNSFNTILGVVLIGTIIYLVIRYKKWNKEILLGVIMFLALTIPGMFITLKNSSDWNEYLECRAYLPLVGLLLVLIQLLPVKVFEKPSQKFGYLLLIPSILFIMTIVESRNYTDPEAFYSSAVNDNPDRAMFQFLLARYYRDNNRPNEAGKHFLLAIDANPGYSKYYHNAGVFYFKTGRPDRAVKYLNLAIDKDSTYKNSYSSLANAYLSMGKQFEALKIWKKALYHWPDYPDAHYYVAAIYAGYGNIEKAIAYADVLVSRKERIEDLALIFSNTGSNLLKTSNHQKALMALNYSFKINPDHTEALSKLSDLRDYYKSENNLQMLREYDSLVQIYGGK